MTQHATDEQAVADTGTGTDTDTVTAAAADQLPDEISPELQAAVDAALAEVDARVAADPDLVHGDVVESVALEHPLDVAVEMCVQSMSFVPDTVRRRVFELENAETIARAAELTAEKDALERKAKQRSERAAATRAQTIAAEAAEQSAVLKSKTCPDCFTVRSASGVCGCD